MSGTIQRHILYLYFSYVLGFNDYEYDFYSTHTAVRNLLGKYAHLLSVHTSYGDSHLPTGAEPDETYLSSYIECADGESGILLIEYNLHNIMRIGIITCWRSSDNYGQQMQCYALQRYLRNEGHDAYLIRYAPKNRKSITGKLLNACLDPQETISNLLKRLNPANRKKIAELKAISHQNIELNKQRKFDQFRQTYLNCTKEIYTSYSQLCEHPPLADAYITGSDQVWHDSLHSKNAGGWFLDFGNKNCLRIAYAASIGRELKKNELPTFGRFLSRFNNISVREENARIQCAKVGHEHTQVTIDPTFLLPVQHYLNMASNLNPENNTPYLFMYILNIGSTKESGWEQVHPYLRDRKWKLEVVCSSGYLPARELIPGHSNLQATIPQWLGLIAGAERVLTSSFHGMVFSILMHKPFMAVMLTNKYAKANTRFVHLLSYLGLENRILDITRPLAPQMERPIDWSETDRRIATLRTSSINFLNEALCIKKSNNIIS